MLKLESVNLEADPIAGAMPAWQATVDAAGWRAAADACRRKNGLLVALWGSERNVDRFAHCALRIPEGLLWMTLRADLVPVPDLSAVFPAASRMQRAASDLTGLLFDADDRRPWLRHDAWPAGACPLQASFALDSNHPNGRDHYAFVPVTGDGVHEIPVGPVHAGTIEPGHFRFQIVGEKVLRLEERLGYKHKGIEKLFESMRPVDAARLAGRISGDSTVAYAWAYAMALEGICGVFPPPRALWLRALMLERERIANHLGDLGFLGNDGGFGFGLAQFMRLKEDLLRTNARIFGHRYCMDRVVPSGVTHDIDPAAMILIAEEASAIERDAKTIKSIYDEHAGLQDRFLTCGRITTELAVRLGITGLALRASGIPFDLREAFPAAPYDQLDLHAAGHRNGDVAARVAVRFDELFESLRLTRAILERMAAGPIAAPAGAFDAIPPGKSGIGWIEGWRGDVMISIETGANAGNGTRLARVHAHDPSWQNWPALEHAVIGNIVPDFPLINKSFNLSYAGHDL
jgi:Ni,Fe-hydrogenase III large subunit